MSPQMSPAHLRCYSTESLISYISELSMSMQSKFFSFSAGNIPRLASLKLEVFLHFFLLISCIIVTKEWKHDWQKDVNKQLKEMKLLCLFVCFNSNKCKNLWLHKARDTAMYCQMKNSFPLNVPYKITISSVLFVLEYRLRFWNRNNHKIVV